MNKNTSLKEISPEENWVDAYCIDIVCPECGKELVIHSGENKKCECGKEYRFVQSNIVYEVQ